MVYVHEIEAEEGRLEARMHPDDARALARKLREDLRRTSDAAFLAEFAR